jgi:hypothetical protein
MLKEQKASQLRILTINLIYSTEYPKGQGIDKTRYLWK